MKKIAKIITLLLLLISLVGVVNFFTLLVFNIDFCFFTFSKVSELSTFTCNILGIGVVLSIIFGLTIVSTISDK